jgi:hypothetical protein
MDLRKTSASHIMENISHSGRRRGRRARLRQCALNLLLISLGILAAALLIEVGLRVFGYAGDSEKRSVVFDTDFGDVPSSSWMFDLEKPAPSPEGECLRINGEAVPLQKAEGETRILFLGDSGTVGAGAGFTNSYPILVRQELERRMPGKHVRVINAGEIGLTTVNELQVFQARLRSLKPDVVVIGLFMANDINFNLRHESGLFGARGQVTVRRRVARWLRQHSAVVHFGTLRFLALNERYRWISAGKSRDSSGSCRLTAMDSAGFDFLDYMMGELALYRKDPSFLTQHCFELMGTVLRTFSQLAEQDGFRLGVVLIPTSSTLSGKVNMFCFPEAGEALQRLGLREADLDFDIPTERILDLCRKNRIRCFDPTGAMRQCGLREVILPKDDHLTRKGHQIMADTVVEGITSW